MEGKERTCWWDLLVFDILKSFLIHLFLPPSVPQAFHGHLCYPPGFVLGAGKFPKKQTPHERQLKNNFQGKTLIFLQLPFLRGTALCHWPHPNPLPSSANPIAPETSVPLEVSSQMWPRATLLFIYAVLARDGRTWIFYHFLPFSFLISICTHGLSSLL